FAEHRQYYPGDEIRHIDWRRSVIGHEQRLQYLYSAFEQTREHAWDAFERKARSTAASIGRFLIRERETRTFPARPLQDSRHASYHHRPRPSWVARPMMSSRSASWMLRSKDIPSIHWHESSTKSATMRMADQLRFYLGPCRCSNGEFGSTQE